MSSSLATKTSLFIIFVLAGALLAGKEIDPNESVFEQLGDYKIDSKDLRNSLANKLEAFHFSAPQQEEMRAWLSEVHSSNQYQQEIKAFEESLDKADISNSVAAKYQRAFEEEKENIGRNDFGAFNAKVRKINRLLFFYFYGRIYDGADVKKSQAIIGEIMKNFANRLEELSKIYYMKTQTITTVRTVTTAGLQSLINFTNEISRRMLDYKQFMKSPQQGLMAAAAELSAKVNADHKILTSNGVDIANRMVEYMKAIKLICDLQKDKGKEPFDYVENLQQVISLLAIQALDAKMKQKDKKAEEAKPFEDIYEWDIKLIQRLLDLFVPAAGEDSGLEMVHDVLKELRPFSTINNPQFFRSMSDAQWFEWEFPETPREQTVFLTKVFDFITHLDEEDRKSLNPQAKKFILSNFDKLALLDNDLLQQSDLAPELIDQLSKSLPDYIEILIYIYDIIANYRVDSEPELPLKPFNFEMFDKYFDEFISEHGDHPLAFYYLPLKIHFARVFANDKDSKIKIQEDLVDTDMAANILKNHKEFEPENNILQNLFKKQNLFVNGKEQITQKDIDTNKYIENTKGLEIVTLGINDLKDKVVVAPEEQLQKISIDEPIKELREEQIPIEKHEEIDQEEEEEGEEEEEEEPEDIGEELEEPEELEAKDKELLQNIQKPFEQPKQTEEEIIEKEVIPEDKEEIIPQENKLIPETKKENLVNVIGELDEQTVDKFRFNDDVEAIVQNIEIVKEEDGVEVEKVYVLLVRKDSPCYDYEMKRLKQM